MQILKKRNSTEDYNLRKDNGITNYASWVESYYNHKGSNRTVSDVFNNTLTDEPVKNPYNLKWEITSNGTWDEDIEKNSFQWLYTFRFYAPVSGNYIFNTRTDRCWNAISSKFNVIDLHGLTSGIEYAGTFYHNEWGMSDTYWWDNALLRQGEEFRWLMYLQFPLAQEDSLTAPLDPNVLINGDGLEAHRHGALLMTITALDYH